LRLRLELKLSLKFLEPITPGTWGQIPITPICLESVA